MLETKPYSLAKKEKKAFLDDKLKGLTRYHYHHCSQYKSMLDSAGFDIKSYSGYEEIPFLPVRLFKLHDLFSVEKETISKTMTSSGTTGQQVSKIYVDKETSMDQTKALTNIVMSVLGSKRSPMIILDTPSVLKDRKMFSARGAGILGFSPFGTKRIYAFNEDMTLDLENLQNFIKENKNSKIFLFGFTFMIYQHFVKEIISRNLDIELSNAILIHGGGWKKLESEAISSSEFKKTLKNLCGLDRVYDYYGMVEQTGSIYMECDQGHLHASVYSDIIIRNPVDFSESKMGEKGIIQTLSVLPKSYPGHSLLTEDEGRLLGEDDCACGRKGKYFEVLGRVKDAEIRGCSDTYEG